MEYQINGLTEFITEIEYTVESTEYDMQNELGFSLLDPFTVEMLQEGFDDLEQTRKSGRQELFTILENPGYFVIPKKIKNANKNDTFDWSILDKLVGKVKVKVKDDLVLLNH